jgi:hypothetical protein
MEGLSLEKRKKSKWRIEDSRKKLFRLDLRLLLKSSKKIIEMWKKSRKTSANHIQ